MRRENCSQVYPPKDASTQSMRESSTRVPRPQIYIAGLRGGQGKITYGVKVNLTRAVDETQLKTVFFKQISPSYEQWQILTNIFASMEITKFCESGTFIGCVNVFWILSNCYKKLKVVLWSTFFILLKLKNKTLPTQLLFVRKSLAALKAEIMMYLDINIFIRL